MATARPEVLLYYKYFSPPLDEENTLQVLQWQDTLTRRLGLVGRVLVSTQGVNGNVAASSDVQTAAYIDEVEKYVLECRRGEGCKARLFEGIQWKRSSCDPSGPLPFPKMRVRRVKEIVSSGGTLPWEDADPEHGGKHLKPREFHNVLTSAVKGDNLVVLDVRNRWEHEVGHFADAAGRSAIHPNMRNFTQFKEYIDTQGPKLLAGKKVLMYCTGGIRCETASAYLVKTGIAEEVCQLAGGIHTYCEEIAGVGNDDSGNGESLFLGSNFVFDQRATLPGGSHVVVGKCSECARPYDTPRGDTICTVCVCPVLVCESCAAEGIEHNVLAGKVIEDGTAPFRRREWYCQAHSYLRGLYYTYLEGFGKAELERQAKEMQIKLRGIQYDSGDAGGSGRKQGQTKKERARLRQQMNVENKKELDQGMPRPARTRPHPNWRDAKLLARQIQRVQAQAKVASHAPAGDIRPPCRSCGKKVCDGRCWGFWKSPGSMGFKAERKRRSTRRAVHLATGLAAGICLTCTVSALFGGSAGFFRDSAPVTISAKAPPVAVSASERPATTTTKNIGASPSRIAWAIPVGGKYERLPLLERLLTQLIACGVSPRDIFVFEDDESRRGLLSGRASARLSATAAKFKVRVFQSGVVRDRRERRDEFGLFLARHYHFMFDSVLYDGESEPYTDPSSKRPFGGNNVNTVVSGSNKREIYDFAVLVEDDLELMDDAVAFFTHMTIAMDEDPSIFCVCGHADNAFHASSLEPKVDAANQWKFPPSSVQNGFYVRRGQHFMAPGFMVSRRVYNDIIRPTWLSLDGNVLQRARWHMTNGNWDSYLDSRIGGRMECVFPSVPIIAHRGSTGYTVRPDRQDAVFSSLRLSMLPSNTDYRDAAKSVVKSNYRKSVRAFIDSAEHYSCPEDIMHLRGKHLVIKIKATKNADREWARVMDFFGIIGLGGHYGAKVRGLHEGTVFLDWLSNRVLIVAEYSPHSARVHAGQCARRDVAAAPSLSALREDLGEALVASSPGQSCTDACAMPANGGHAYV
eukprot:g717.t1